MAKSLWTETSETETNHSLHETFAVGIFHSNETLKLTGAQWLVMEAVLVYSDCQFDRL